MVAVSISSEREDNGEKREMMASNFGNLDSITIQSWRCKLDTPCSILLYNIYTLN